MTTATYGFLTRSNKFYECLDAQQRDLICQLNTELEPVVVKRNVAYRRDFRAQGESRWFDAMFDTSGNRICWM